MMNEIRRIARPKDAITLVALGERYAVWMMRSEQIGIVRLQTKDIIIVDISVWQPQKRFNTEQPSITQMGEVDAHCTKVLAQVRKQI
jgi:hypothetical protein